MSQPETVDTPLGLREKPGLSFVVCTPNKNVYDALVRIVDEVGGIQPIATRDTETLRTLYENAPARNIINLPSEEMLKRLGIHVACMTMTVADPKAAANQAMDYFKAYGVDAGLHLDSDPELPSGFMAFVTITDWPVPLLFWPEHVDPEVLKRLTPPRPWVKNVTTSPVSLCNFNIITNEVSIHQ